MSEFVNYNKREVSLPPGCKNLADLLAKSGHFYFFDPATIGARSKTSVTRNKSFTTQLSGIGKYVAMAFESHSLMFTMWLMSPDSRLTVRLIRGHGAVRASANVYRDTREETAVSEFFAFHHLAMPIDIKMPASFQPSLPWNMPYDISPLSSDPFAVSLLLKDLFRYVCDLTGKSELQIHYSEVIDAV